MGGVLPACLPQTAPQLASVKHSAVLFASEVRGYLWRGNVKIQGNTLTCGSISTVESLIWTTSFFLKKKRERKAILLLFQPSFISHFGNCCSYPLRIIRVQRVSIYAIWAEFDPHSVICAVYRADGYFIFLAAGLGRSLAPVLLRGSVCVRINRFWFHFSGPDMEQQHLRDVHGAACPGGRCLICVAHAAPSGFTRKCPCSGDHAKLLIC